MGGGGSALVDAKRNKARLALACHKQEDRLFAGLPGFSDSVGKIFRLAHLSLVGLDDHVADAQPFLGGHTVGRDLTNHNTVDVARHLIILS